ncbi:hypothetical protein V8F33_006155 [Rhypophila sp. PSN 637]
MSPITTAQPSSLHSHIDHQPPKRSTSTSERLSQRIRSNLRHLRLGGGGGSNHHEEQQKGPEFKIVHSPDRPVRLVSPLEAPTEEECFDEIKGWHSAAAAASISGGAPPPQLPPVEFDSHRFGLGLGLGISPSSSLNLDDEGEEGQSQQNPENILLTKRGESPMLGGGNFEQQSYGIFEFEDPEDNNLDKNPRDKDKHKHNQDHQKEKYILQPVPVPVPFMLPIGSKRQYYPRRDSFVSDDDDSNRRVEEKGDIKPWESRSLPPSPSPSPSTPHFQILRNGNGKLVAARLLNHSYSPSYPTSTSAAAANSSSQLNTPSRGGGTGTGTGSSEEQFKLELEDSDPDPALDVRDGTKDETTSQMQNLWSHLRRIKNQGGGGQQRKSEGLVSNFSSTATSSGDEYYSHDGEAEIHEAQVVDLELRRKMERLRRRENCPYCGGQVHFRETEEAPSYFCGFCRADLRGVVYGDYGVQEQRMVMGMGAGTGQPAVVQMQTAGPGREEVRGRQRPDRGYDADRPYITGHSGRRVDVQPGTVPPKPLRQRALLEQRALDGGGQQGSRGEAASRENFGPQNTGRDQIPANSSKPQPVPIDARKYQQEEAQSSKFSSSSSASSAPRQPPPRLADRPILAEAKRAPSPSLAQQLRHRPAPPPPERTVYANDIRNARGNHRAILGQQSRPNAREAVKQISAPNLSGKQQAAPSPLRHEITRKQANHFSGPLLPATVYRPLPPLPDEQGQQAADAPRTASLPSRPFAQPPLVPRSSLSPGYVNPSSPGLSTSSRPNQSRPLNPEQLQPVPHRPNHSSPLLNQAFTPARPSPHAPGTTKAIYINHTPASPFTQQLHVPIRPAPPPPDPRLNQLSKPNSNLLASALEQATRNARDQLAVPEPPSASSSTYSPLNESPTTPTASTFSTASTSSTTGDSRAATAGPQRTNPFSTSSSSYHQTHMYPYHSATTQDGLNIITPAPSSYNTQAQKTQGNRTGTEAAAGGVPPPSATEITPSSAQIPMLRYDDSIMPWMTPQDKANFETAIADKGDDAQVYMDIFDDYAGYSSSVSSSSTEDGGGDRENKKNKKK